MNESLIRRTFELARLGIGTTWPNPLVGCVIVKNGRIIGEGLHRKQGEDHAEIDALKNCTESPEGATVYVNLEPCCHTKKTTPPCAQRLIQEKIKKVIISNLDPNPEVNGKGVELLRTHGIEVEHGILADEGAELNEVFFLNQKLQRPFVHFKTAATLDGKTALMSGESQWITGQRAREHVHLLRSQHQAIVTGGETVRKDNPKFTVRLPGYSGPQPYRVVFTKSGDLPKDLHLFSDEEKDKTIIYKNMPIEKALDDLYRKKIVNILLECGPCLAGDFMKASLIDRVSLFLNPSFLGEGKSILSGLDLNSLAQRPRLSQVKTTLFGEDLYLTGKILKD
jgi:diaminohydroxyphosphoribosylaminopyrimidine deaminase/5-amino-6-(5-phosphoribosylamino)uracil reductase